jgi:hypothetical protein
MNDGNFNAFENLGARYTDENTERSDTDMTPRKNPNAMALGRRGGKAGTPAQNQARRQNAQRGGGRPGRVCTTCGEPVVGGHVDRRLDETCGEHGWRWQQRASATTAPTPPPLPADIAVLLTQAIVMFDAAPESSIPVATITDWLTRARAVVDASTVKV